VVTNRHNRGEAPYDPGVSSRPADDPSQEVRRIILVALLAVLVAAPIALVLMLRDTESADLPAAASVQLFDSSFRETGFVAHSVKLDDDLTAAASTTRLRHDFGGGETAWVVARCDTGSVTVQVGALSSSRDCTGKPIGVAALDASTATDGPLEVVATVSEPQGSTWGVAVYR
jgi:hypothetical protein